MIKTEFQKVYSKLKALAQTFDAAQQDELDGNYDRFPYRSRVAHYGEIVTAVTGDDFFDVVEGLANNPLTKDQLLALQNIGFRSRRYCGEFPFYENSTENPFSIEVSLPGEGFDGKILKTFPEGNRERFVLGLLGFAQPKIKGRDGEWLPALLDRDQG